VLLKVDIFFLSQIDQIRKMLRIFALIAVLMGGTAATGWFVRVIPRGERGESSLRRSTLASLCRSGMIVVSFHS